jgi:predicted O-methyltransferase YrrM
MLARMRQLEEIDARDRTDGTPKEQRLRQIPPETGKFIALMAASAPAGEWIEIGTSAGYSTLWLALAARQRGGAVTTYEIDPAKVHLAAETFRLAGMQSFIKQVQGDARQFVPELDSIAFCFIDTEKDLYAGLYEAVVPRMAPGGLLLADNAIDHASALQPMLDRALSDPRVDALIVPVGKGVLVCRKA